MTFKRRIRSYYAALRAGEPLGEFFADEDSIVKFGISDRLAGGDTIREGLSTQTNRTQTGSLIVKISSYIRRALMHVSVMMFDLSGQTRLRMSDTHSIHDGVERLR
jgi:hypothetical protein